MLTACSRCAHGLLAAGVIDAAARHFGLPLGRDPRLAVRPGDGLDFVRAAAADPAGPRCAAAAAAETDAGRLRCTRTAGPLG